MAEQLIDRRIPMTAAGFQPARVDAASLVATPQNSSSDALRQARTCLDTAGRRLRKGEAEHADEVLSLLQAATGHLRQAMTPTAAVEVRTLSE